MALVKITENPTTGDTILLEFSTPDATGCFVSNPYKVDKVTIYYVERDFSSGNFSTYNSTIYETEKLQAAITAEATACTNPTDENIAKAKRLREVSNSAATTNPFYFNEAQPVKIIGTSDSPAWLSSDTENAQVTNIEEDEDGNPIYGKFQYEWEPLGMREGDYFVCWTWTPQPAGDSYSEHYKFTLEGNTQLTTSIPTHYTVPEKYETLLERYTPEMFKMLMCDNDRSPDVINKFNKSLASQFTALENLTNQIVDLQDANAVHELLIPYLSNLFDLKLKSNDPTRWRRQVKRAIPLFKAKGTKHALEEAMAQAGIQLIKITKLWQIISSYTWQESFTVVDDSNAWELIRPALAVDQDNFGLWIRPVNGNEYIELSSDYVSFSTVDGITTMSWLGETLSVEPLSLTDGDSLLVLYKYNEILDSTQQTLENYIRTLSLADQRDERSQDYPVKNWNVRVIEEDDPLFDLVIPNRHPYHDDLIFGQIRTEFPYSENVYNMDEYNGSIRNSKNPCDIDKNFIDPCSNGLSSKYNIELEIENLSNDRIVEAQKVLIEFTPFHAVLHMMNFLGGVNEYVQPPEEDVEMLIKVHGEEFVLAGEGQMWLNRSMKLGLGANAVLRNELAESELVHSGSGIAHNDEIVVFSGDVLFDRIGMSLNGGAFMEVLAPSSLEGTYHLQTPHNNAATVVETGLEPIDNCDSYFSTDQTLNSCAFTFRVSNPVTDGTLCNIYQDNVFTFSDLENDFGKLGVQASFDVAQGNAAYAWKIKIEAYSSDPYVIADVLPNGSLVLSDPDQTLPTSNANSVHYEIFSNTTSMLEAETGSLKVQKRGRTEVLDSDVQDIFNVSKIGFYQVVNGNQYKISGYVPATDDQFYLEGYDEGDMAGTNLTIYQRLVDNKVGYLSHRGAKLQITGNLESDLEIQNGHNSLIAEDERVENDHFKENYLVVIDGDTYFMNDIDGDSPSGKTTIVLKGIEHYWKTLVGGGTAVNYSIYRYTKNGVTIPGQQFDLESHTFRAIDNNGSEIVTATIENDDEVGSGLTEYVHQQEGINFTIEYSDGTTETGEI